MIEAPQGIAVRQGLTEVELSVVHSAGAQHYSIAPAPGQQTAAAAPGQQQQTALVQRKHARVTQHFITFWLVLDMSNSNNMSLHF